MKWNSNSAIFKPPANPTVIKDMPFYGSTFYRDNFKKHPRLKENFEINSKKSQYKNPVCPELPFISESTSSHIYKPFKTDFTNGKKNENVIKNVKFILK